MAYDIIGDTHGCAETLWALLETMGYRYSDGHYRHSSRIALFLGDFIDRGPYQRETLKLVQAMVEHGAAMAVMGNHEYNAIAYATYDAKLGKYLRPHNDKNNAQHEAFLQAYAQHPTEYKEAIQWFRSLPLWLEIGGIRLVHACWDPVLIQRLSSVLAPGNRLTDEVLLHSADNERWEFEALETILKGKEVPLRAGAYFFDKDHNRRQHIRVKWWDTQARTYQAAYLGPNSAISHIPDNEMDVDHLIEYSSDLPPVFFGHYWLNEEPGPLAANVACLDYSVAKPGGKLVAYRWDGEASLLAGNYVSVERVEV